MAGGIIEAFDDEIDYRASSRFSGLRRSLIHMRRWAGRITFAVTDVLVQRLQAITCAHAIAEGTLPQANSATIDCDTADPRAGYRTLWNSIQGAGAWNADP